MMQGKLKVINHFPLFAIVSWCGSSRWAIPRDLTPPRHASDDPAGPLVKHTLALDVIIPVSIQRRDKKKQDKCRWRTLALLRDPTRRVKIAGE